MLILQTIIDHRARVVYHSYHSLQIIIILYKIKTNALLNIET